VETGNAGGFFEIGLGTATAGTPGMSGNAALGNSLGNVDVRKMYGYYKFGNCELLVGKTDGWLFSLVPQQRLGANLLTVWDFGFGNFYDGRFTQLRFTQNINKQFTYAISLVTPQNTNATFTSGTTSVSRASYAQLPTIAGKLSMNFGVVSLFPAAAWGQVKWQDLPSGYDDSATGWYAVLPVKVVAGPFTGLFQVGYGQNLQTILNPGNTNSFQQFVRVAGQVKNTTGVNAFMDLGWTFGPVTPHLFFGFDNADNNDAWRAGDSNNRRYSYGAAVNYIVAPGFMISPELTYFDFGKAPNTVGSPDIGKDWMAGVQFVFAF